MKPYTDLNGKYWKFLVFGDKKTKNVKKLFKKSARKFKLEEE